MAIGPSKKERTRDSAAVRIADRFAPQVQTLGCLAAMLESRRSFELRQWRRLGEPAWRLRAVGPQQPLLTIVRRHRRLRLCVSPVRFAAIAQKVCSKDSSGRRAPRTDQISISPRPPPLDASFAGGVRPPRSARLRVPQHPPHPAPVRCFSAVRRHAVDQLPQRCRAC